MSVEVLSGLAHKAVLLAIFGVGAAIHLAMELQLFQGILVGQLVSVIHRSPATIRFFVFDEPEAFSVVVHIFSS